MSDKPQVSDEDAMGAALVEIQQARAAGEPSPLAAPDEAAPAAEVVSPEQAPDAKTTTEPVPAADAQAPAAETPEQVLAKKQAELHRVTSEIGRVSALNRANQEKAQRISELERELQSARKPPETQAEALTQFEQLAEKVKDFPELLSVVQTVGAALKEVKDAAQATAKQTAQEAIAPIEPLRRQHMEQQKKEQDSAIAEDLQTFETTYPKAREVIVSDDFKAWLPKQPPAIQYSFRKGETPAEALAVLDAYDAHLRRTGKPSIAHTPTTQHPPAAEVPAKQTSADRLNRAAGIASRSSNGAKGALPPQDDFEGSVEFFRNQRLAKQARAAA